MARYLSEDKEFALLDLMDAILDEEKAVARRRGPTPKRKRR